MGRELLSGVCGLVKANCSVFRIFITGVVRLLAWNLQWWVCLHHGNWYELQVRSFYVPWEPFKHFPYSHRLLNCTLHQRRSAFLLAVGLRAGLKRIVLIEGRGSGGLSLGNTAGSHIPSLRKHLTDLGANLRGFLCFGSRALWTVCCSAVIVLAWSFCFRERRQWDSQILRADL